MDPTAAVVRGTRLGQELGFELVDWARNGTASREESFLALGFLSRDDLGRPELEIVRAELLCRLVESKKPDEDILLGPYGLIDPAIDHSMFARASAAWMRHAEMTPTYSNLRAAFEFHRPFDARRAEEVLRLAIRRFPDDQRWIRMLMKLRILQFRRTNDRQYVTDALLHAKSLMCLADAQVLTDGGVAALVAWHAKQPDLARAWSAALRRAASNSGAAYGCGFALHQADNVDGLLAGGHMGHALDCLRSAAEREANAVMRSFGPWMSLAQHLVLSRPESVGEYLIRCRQFWTSPQAGARIDSWLDSLKRGEAVHLRGSEPL